MRTTLKTVLTALAISAAAGSLPLPAQDLLPFELGARAASLAGAFTARSDDVLSVMTNPAGLAYLPGFRFKTNLIFGRSTLTLASPATASSFVSDPLQFRGCFALSARILNRLGLGIGIFAPFTFDTDWGSEWPGRFTSISAAFNAVYVRPALAIEVVKGLALGVGLDLVYARIDWRHAQPFRLDRFSLPAPASVDSLLELKGHGTGFVVGLAWKPHRKFRAGLRYQHQVPIEFKGLDNFVVSSLDLGWMTVPDPVMPWRAVDDLARQFFKSQDFQGRLTLPRTIALGVSYAPLEAISVDFELQWDNWSRFGDWGYRAAVGDQDLNPDFGQDLRDFYGIVPDYGYQTAGLSFRDAWRFKTGLEYRPAPHLAVRTGFARHQSPSGHSGQNPLDPVPDQNLVSAGFGYEGPAFSLFEDKEICELSFDIYFRYAFARDGGSLIADSMWKTRSRRWDFGVGVGFNF
jgi:long-chain fatty acid transport protein